MIDFTVLLAGYVIKICVSDIYFTTLKKKLVDYTINNTDTHDIYLTIVDEQNICVDQRYRDYVTSAQTINSNIVYSYSKGGMFGCYDHSSDTGFYYISRKKGVIKRNPLLPLFSALSVFLPKHNALLFHCSAVIDNNSHTHIFTGKSGSGKTTISRLLCDQYGFSLIADDTAILKISQTGEIEAHSTPFWNVLKPTARAGSVVTINAIYKNETTYVIPENHRVLLNCLLKNSIYLNPRSKFSPFFSTLLKTSIAISHQCKCNSVYFEKNTSFWEELKNE